MDAFRGHRELWPFLGLLSSLFLLPSAALAAASILVNGSADDRHSYLCWSPDALSVTLTESDQSLSSVVIKVESLGGTGALLLQESVQKPTSGTLDGHTLITVSVPADGRISGLWVAGASASDGHKDTAIVVERMDGSEIARREMMVRVRKNAESLNRTERDAFLFALAAVHRLSNGGIGSLYSKHQRIHGDAFELGIHGAPVRLPLFLAWHRSFLMHLERELQEIDATVAMPYWRFDRPAPQVFSEAFMGRISGNLDQDAFIVKWVDSNPINNWEMFDGQGPMTRTGNGDSSAPIPSDRLSQLIGAAADYETINGLFENRYHNGAHNAIGGWLATATSPRDPLFYLLHANVDRAWAEWQWLGDRFDDTGNVAEHYHGTGSYPGDSVPDRFRKSSYANDRVWPWVAQGGDQGTADPLDDWPDFAFPMPLGNGTSPEPTPAQMVSIIMTPMVTVGS